VIAAHSGGIALAVKALVVTERDERRRAEGLGVITLEQPVAERGVRLEPG
jgi:hypothetical protein